MEGTDKKPDRYRLCCESEAQARALAQHLIASPHVVSATVSRDNAGAFVGLVSHLYDDDLLALVQARFPSITKGALYWFF